MEHFVILIEQHKAVRKFIQAAQKSESAQERSEILNKIRVEFEAHMALEEKHVYPVLENFESLKREVFGFWREHERIRQDLRQAIATSQDERQFQSLLARLTQSFEIHVREEENRIFPEACRVVPKHQLESVDRNIDLSVKQTKKVA